MCFSADSRFSARLTFRSCTIWNLSTVCVAWGILAPPPNEYAPAMSRVTSKAFVRSPPVLLKLVSEPA